MNSKISGTKEWSVESVNCLSGCPHDCRYCYARANALRFGRIKTPGEWKNAKLRERELQRPRRLADGPVMFPTTHDITPGFLDPCLTVIGKILEAGNRLLIVSKPHLECIRAICRHFEGYRDEILFRFTIGATDEQLLAYWEPGAPSFAERFICLRRAERLGFKTSVSCEPLLEPEQTLDLFRRLEPYVTDTIWIGKLNQIRTRVVPGTAAAAIERIEDGQTDQRVLAIYEALKDEPKVRWKDSYKQVIGLEQPTAAGLDV